MLLSRKKYVPNINQNVPKCVIQTLADCEGLRIDHESLNDYQYLNKVIKKLNEFEPHQINKIHSKDDLKKIARYLNPHQPWTIDTIIPAFQFSNDLYESLTNNTPFNYPDHFSVLQTPTDYQVIDIFFVYLSLIKREIYPKFDTTFDQLLVMFHHSKSPRYILQKHLELWSKSARLTDIIQIISHQSMMITKPETNLLQTIQPRLKLGIESKTFEECILSAAINYKIDISESDRPDCELDALYYDEFPYDQTLKEWYQKNPNIFDLLSNFNPKFPKWVYSDKDLRSFCLLEGFTKQEMERTKHYQLLVNASNENSFYLGWYPSIINQETPIYCLPVNENLDCIVCYGIKSSELLAVTFDELKDGFQSSMNFLNPLNGRREHFSTRNIQKLENILSNNDKAKDLLEVIQRVKQFNGSIELVTKKLIDQYRYHSEYYSALFEKFIQMSFYMRGWKGPGNEYPLAHCPVDDQDFVDSNVNYSMEQFFNQINENKTLGSIFLDLPLYNYNNGYTKCNVSEGSTIQGRINIIKEGTSVSACIRTSSNIFCTTIHRIMVCLGLNEPFPIKVMRQIG